MIYGILSTEDSTSVAKSWLTSIVLLTSITEMSQHTSQIRNLRVMSKNLTNTTLYDTIYDTSVPNIGTKEWFCINLKCFKLPMFNINAQRKLQSYKIDVNMICYYLLGDA